MLYLYDENENVIFESDWDIDCLDEMINRLKELRDENGCSYESIKIVLGSDHYEGYFNNEQLYTIKIE